MKDKKKIRVCHITSVHQRYDTRIFYKECVSLAEQYEVVLLCADSGKKEYLQGVKIQPVSQEKNRWKRILTSSGKIRKIAEQVDADIYHFHDPELLRLGVQLKRKGKKVIYDSHEDVPRQIMSKYWIPSILRPIISSLYEGYEDYCVKKLDAVVTVTSFIGKRFKKINKNTFVIYNYPVLTDRWESEEKIEKERAICFAGSISESNGIKKVIEAINQTDIKLYLAGVLQGDMEEYIKKHNPKENIIFLGYLNRTEVYQLYQKCSAGIVVDLPTGNNIEGLPIKLFEFMNAGLPVITSDFPIRKKIIEQNQCGVFVKPYNIEQMITVIKDIVNDLQKQKEYGENGKRAVLERYNWEKEKEKLHQIYRTILQRKGE